MKPKIIVKGQDYTLFCNPFHVSRFNLWRAYYFIDDSGYIQPKDITKDVFNLKAWER